MIVARLALLGRIGPDRATTASALAKMAAHAAERARIGGGEAVPLFRAQLPAGQVDAAGGALALVEPWHRLHHSEHGLLDPWPVAIPKTWLSYVNHQESEPELTALRRCVVRGTPYGVRDWIERTVKELGLESSLRPRGRPKKPRAS
jgi:hypothetical protein